MRQGPDEASTALFRGARTKEKAKEDEEVVRKVAREWVGKPPPRARLALPYDGMRFIRFVVHADVANIIDISPELETIRKRLAVARAEVSLGQATIEFLEGQERNEEERLRGKWKGKGRA